MKSKKTPKMPKISVPKDKFDAVMRRMIETEPMKRKDEKHPR